MALGDISNPMIADIAGALSFRQAQMDAQQKREDEIRFKQLAAQAIPDLPEGSPVREMMMRDPVKAAAFAHALDIPLNKGEQIAKFSNDVKIAAQLAHADPVAAHDYIGSLIPQYKQNGQSTKMLENFYNGVNDAIANNDEQGLHTYFNSLYVMNDSLNPAPAKEGFTLSDGQTRYDAKGKVIASTPKVFNPNDPNSQVKVHSGTILPDGTSVALMSDGSTQVQSADGKTLTGSDRVDAIKQSRQYGIDVAGSTAGAKKTAESAAGVVSTAKQSENRSAQLSTAISEAEKLLPKATGSYVGAAADVAGRVVGISTESSQASAKLDTLAGWLTANVPRMEGPQSDKDVQSYQTMAAKVGDRTLPVAERQAALSILKTLQEKYSDLNKNIISGQQNTFGTRTQSAADRLKALTGGQ